MVEVEARDEDLLRDAIISLVHGDMILPMRPNLEAYEIIRKYREFVNDRLRWFNLQVVIDPQYELAFVERLDKEHTAPLRRKPISRNMTLFLIVLRRFYETGSTVEGMDVSLGSAFVDKTQLREQMAQVMGLDVESSVLVENVDKFVETASKSPFNVLSVLGDDRYKILPSICAIANMDLIRDIESQESLFNEKNIAGGSDIDDVFSETEEKE